jgi:hypothetical protein
MSASPDMRGHISLTPSSTVTSTLNEVTFSLRSPSDAILRTRPGKWRPG